MNRDYKLIFENYRLVREQQSQNTYLTLLINAINGSKDIAPEVKKKMIEFFSQPDKAEGLKGAIEAGQNETINQQTGQAPYAAEMPVQDNRSGAEMQGQYPSEEAGPSGPVYDTEGNPVNPEDLKGKKPLTVTI